MVTAVSGILGVVLLAGILSPSEYGRLALALTVAVLVQQVVLGGLNGALLRYTSTVFKSWDTQSLLRALGRTLLTALVLLLAVGGVAIGSGMLLGRDALPMILVALLFAILSGAQTTISSIQSALRNRKTVALHQAISSVGRYPLAAAMAAWVSADGLTALLCFCAVEFVVLCSQLRILHQVACARDLALVVAPPHEDVLELRKEVEKYSRPFVVFGLLMWLQLACDRYALAYLLDVETVGRYAVLVQLGYYPIAFLGAAVTQYVSPIVFARAGQGADSDAWVARVVQGLVRGALAVTGLLVCIAVLVGRPTLELTAGDQYTQLAPVLPLVVAAGGLFAAGQIAALQILAGSASDVLLRPKVVTSSLYVVGVCLGAAKAGVLGVALASACYSAIYCLWVRRLASRQGGVMRA